MMPVLLSILAVEMTPEIADLLTRSRDLREVAAEIGGSGRASGGSGGADVGEAEGDKEADKGLRTAEALVVDFVAILGESFRKRAIDGRGT